MKPLTKRHIEKAVEVGREEGEVVRDTKFIREKKELFYGFENS
jgi:hypothetical protein